MLQPNSPVPVSSFAVTFGPTCVHVEPVLVNVHAAPMPLLSSGAEIRAVFPSPDRAPPQPKPDCTPLWIRAAPGYIGGPSCVQVDPERVKIHATPELSAPIKAVFPSAESATLLPKSRKFVTPVPISFGPCCVQVDPARVNSHAAPTPELSARPPTKAVLPSADNATLTPNIAS